MQDQQLNSFPMNCWPFILMSDGSVQRNIFLYISLSTLIFFFTTGLHRETKLRQQ